MVQIVLLNVNHVLSLINRGFVQREKENSWLKAKKCENVPEI